MRVYLETERLVLREFTGQDVDNVVELDSDPEVMRYLTGGAPTPGEKIRDEILPRWLAFYDRADGLGYWAAVEKATGRFLGWFHFRQNRQPVRGDGSRREGVELGYRLRRDAWGKGYGTEGSRALIRKGFTELGVTRVYAETMTVNAASRRVMAKAGLRHVGTFVEDWPDHIPGDEQGAVEYALTRAEWARAEYRAVEEEVFAGYQEGRYDEAVALIRSALPHLPHWRSDLAHQCACLLAVAGRPTEALAELRAAYDAGGWWHRRILADDDDLAGLRALDGFDELVALSHARATAADPATRPPIVHRPDGPARGVLVALHGAGQDADDAAERWRTATEAGFVVAAPDSSQRNTPSYRSWPDPAIGGRDIAAALDGLPDLPPVLAGFSAGGRQAVVSALAGHAAHFVVVAPAIGPEHLDDEHVTAAAARGVAGTVVVGARDLEVCDGALAAVERLRRAGV
ncbi:GNAT family N-acetyltransferase, partial [Actinomycetes bacterium KLBMP 9797]